MLNQTEINQLGTRLHHFITVDNDFNIIGCDHTFNKTIAWLKEQDKDFDIDAVVRWLIASGAHCDCTFMLNIYTKSQTEADDNIEHKKE